ncbi:MAG: hypothetical protein WAO07_13610, partial [Desulfobacterales bacterium]
GGPHGYQSPEWANRPGAGGCAVMADDRKKSQHPSAKAEGLGVKDSRGRGVKQKRPYKPLLDFLAF